MIENLLVRFLRWIGAEEVPVEDPPALPEPVTAKPERIGHGDGTRDPFAQYPEGINPTLGADGDGPPPVTLEDPEAEDDDPAPADPQIATGTWARAMQPRTPSIGVAATEAAASVTVHEVEQPQPMDDGTDVVDPVASIFYGIGDDIVEPTRPQMAVVAKVEIEDDDGPAPEPLPLCDEPEIDAAMEILREEQQLNDPWFTRDGSRSFSPAWRFNLVPRSPVPTVRPAFMVALAATMVLFAGWFIADRLGWDSSPARGEVVESRPRDTTGGVGASKPPGRVDIGALAETGKVEPTEPPTAPIIAASDDDAVATTDPDLSSEASAKEDDDGDTKESVAEVPSTPSLSPPPVAISSPARGEVVVSRPRDTTEGVGASQPISTPTLVPVPPGTQTSPLTGWAAQREINRRLGHKSR